MKMATTPVELMKAPSPATTAINREISRVSLLPAVLISQSPSCCATPVRTSPSPMTNKAPSSTILGSLNPARACGTVITPVRGRAVSMSKPTASMRGLLMANIAMALPSNARTTARSVFIDCNRSSFP